MGAELVIEVAITTEELDRAKALLVPSHCHQVEA